RFGQEMLDRRLSAGKLSTVVMVAWAALVNILAFGAAWLVCDFAKGSWFGGGGVQASVGSVFLNAVLELSLYVQVIAVWFRPRKPTLRIVDLDDDTNYAAYLFVVINVSANVLRSWILVPMAAGVPSEAISAGLLINALLFAAILMWSAIHWRKAIGKLIVT